MTVTAKSQHRRLLAACLGLLLLGSCDKNTAEPMPTTGITGMITVTDENRQALAREGVTVTLLNANPVQTATTNKAGSFTIGSVPAGTYTLLFSRPGLSEFLLRGVAHAQSEALTKLPETYPLIKESAIRATNLRADVAASGSAVTFFTSVSSPQPTDRLDYVVYFGTAPDVSYLTSTSFIAISTGSYPPSAALTSTWTMDRTKFMAEGFGAPSGSTAYAVAYGRSDQGFSYTNPATGTRLFWPSPNRTPSQVVRFVMP